MSGSGTTSSSSSTTSNDPGMIWAGIPIDLSKLAGYGYNDLVLVNGYTLPRIFAYQYAGILQSGGNPAAGAAISCSQDGTKVTAAPRALLNLQMSLRVTDNPSAGRADVAMAGDVNGNRGWFDFLTSAGGLLSSTNFTTSYRISAKTLRVDGAAGTERALILSTNGLARAALRLDTDAESGNNSGSTIAFSQYNDDGTYARNLLTFDRQTGNATVPQLATLAGGALAPTRPGTDNTTNVATTAFIQNLFATRSLSGTSGYYQLPGGLILQWGYGQTTSNGGLAVTLPIAFPTASLVISPYVAGSSGPALYGLSTSVLGTGSRSNFTIWAANAAGAAQSGLGVGWFALGY